MTDLFLQSCSREPVSVGNTYTPCSVYIIYLMGVQSSSDEIPTDLQNTALPNAQVSRLQHCRIWYIKIRKEVSEQTVVFYVYAALSKISNERYNSTKPINRIHRASSRHCFIYSIVVLGFQFFGLTWNYIKLDLLSSALHSIS